MRWQNRDKPGGLQQTIIARRLVDILRHRYGKRTLPGHERRYRIGHPLYFSEVRLRDTTIGDRIAKTVGELDEYPSDRQAEIDEAAAYVRAWLARLPVRQREAVELRAMGLRYWHIGTVMGISESRAASLVRQARKKAA